ncbi:MAG TPA: hypothetical protein VFZ21_14680 [Gemmatimonadaceae bacterium]|jgi:uncharacterized membrane protein YeaQ/YmgE (transglycosylase-associated protein family)|nr:hypothetical protein [Gemmatimonadaceae bacterium]
MPTLRGSLRAAILALSLVLPSASAGAQQLSPGTRVRVKSTSLVAPIIGAFQGMRRDTLVIMEEGMSAQQWTFASASVDRLEVSTGVKRGNRGPITRWALIGAGVGAVAGVLAAYALEGSGDSEYNNILSGAVGAGVGAGLGAAWGWRVEQEQWRSVPLPRRVGVMPSRTGVRLVFGTSF